MNYSEYNTLQINGNLLEGREIITYCRAHKEQNVRQLGEFMADWLQEVPEIKVQTSGSTGKPKTIKVEKNRMLQSASMSAEFFGFQKGQTALLCLPVTYIAGKMMVIRALYSGLKLLCIEPDNNPLSTLQTGTSIDFAPLIPMQLKENTSTASIKKILLGGAPLDPPLELKLRALPNEIYHGYGMTETLSHVALRRINGPGSSVVYRALQGIAFSTDNRNCLIVEAPFLKEKVVTNDVVNLINKTAFSWKGRADNVINSGGIKLFPEVIEKKLFPLITGRFFVAGLPDERLGEKVCLFIEGKDDHKKEAPSLLNRMAPYLNKYEKPRAIFFVQEFTTTPSGKVNRRETIKNKVL